MTGSATCRGSPRTSTISSGSGSTRVWLSPTFPSPNADWGYDVADYLGVHPDLGTAGDLDALIGAARDRGIGILLDLVPNHTSTAHPWFEDARSSRTAAHRDWYVWADPQPDGSPPNNWVSSFFGPAWTLDERTGQILPAQLPARAGGPQLVERRRARRVRPHPPLLVRSRRGRLPDRRRPHGRQGPRAAGQPARRPRRPPARAAARPGRAATTRIGPRCTTCTDAGARSPMATTRRACSSARRSSTGSRTCSRSTARATSSDLAFNIPFLQAPVRGAVAGVDGRGDRATRPRRVHAGVDGQQPRRLASRRRAGPRGRPVPPGARC